MIGFIPNLHVILLGDEFRAGEFLPYGKQLVRQLMAQGRFSNKRSVSPADGVLVEAWTSGEHRWVRITAVGCKAIFMDSGVASLHNIGLLSPDITGRDGLLHYGTTIRSYVGEKKLLGSITPPSIGCTPSIEKFPTPAYAAEVDIVDGHEVRNADSESLLAVKKAFTSRIPASIFTGKLRLWMQAHYGKPLAAWDLQPNFANQPPGWDWDTRTATGANITWQFHSAHTGIFTDVLKRHWLVQLGIKGAYATPNTVNVSLMRCPPCVEKLRAYLLDSSSLSPTDKERVEAYILSQSYPDYDFSIASPCTIPTNSSQGYGWHFNWDGSLADIISVGVRDKGGGVYDYKSTHYRITITRNAEYIDDRTNTPLQNEARRWRAELSVVEESGYWRNSKWVNVIACPDWAEQSLSITGTILGGQYGSNAPFYCFYTRNDLNVVRHSSSGGDAVAQSMLTSTPQYFGGNYGWGEASGIPCNYKTLGLEGGTSEYRQRSSTATVSSFTVGARASVSSSVESYSFSRAMCSSKSIVDTSWYGSTFQYESGAFVGDPLSPTFTSLGCLESTGSWSVVTLGAGWYSGSASVSLTYSGSSVSGTHSEGANTLCVIPFGDAEAAYLWGKKWASDSASGGSSVFTGPSSHVVSSRQTATDNGDLVARWDCYYYADTAFGGSTPETENTYNETLIGALCVSNAGVKPFTTENVVSAFFAGEPYTHVPQQFWTVTSAGLDSSIDGEGIPITGGYGSGGVFMGWA